jgi:hypothetical protein
MKKEEERLRMENEQKEEEAKRLVCQGLNITVFDLGL